MESEVGDVVAEALENLWPLAKSKEEIKMLGKWDGWLRDRLGKTAISILYPYE